MKKIGITGQTGFIGSHLFNTLGLYPDKYERVPFDKAFFQDEALLDRFVAQCDVVVHLAGMNKHNDPNSIYQTNVGLAAQLGLSLKRTESKAHVIFSSSTQEEKDNLYGQSKKEARQLLARAVADAGGVFTGMIVPNIFGPFGAPYYNSVVATFCHQLTNDEQPQIKVNGEVRLLYVGDLCLKIIRVIDERTVSDDYLVAHTSVVYVSDILKTLEIFADAYCKNGVIPVLKSSFEVDLFNTLRSYLPLQKRFPVKYIQKTDPRGSFVEVIRLHSGGQVSFSTTLPGIVRGNHFHTRKIERFSIIKGNALIQLRRIGTGEVLNFQLSGEEPAYVDMPVWYTHNIKNTGQDDLYTIFWINEFYNDADPDTYFEDVQTLVAKNMNINY